MPPGWKSAMIVAFHREPLVGLIQSGALDCYIGPRPDQREGRGLEWFGGGAVRLPRPEVSPSTRHRRKPARAIVQIRDSGGTALVRGWSQTTAREHAVDPGQGHR